MRLTFSKLTSIRMPLSRQRLIRACGYFADCAQRRIRSTIPWQAIDLIFTDDAIMAEINQAILRHEGPTDVITQRYDAIPGEAEGLTGEIYINLDEVKRHHNPQHEILLYLAHGCDHLSGATDTTPGQCQTMRRRELRWIRQLSRRFPA